uniref:G_PROTEIN_RECEP_F1_2 domain-containing protein n=2 Tax=Caenorhabditis tropicalis TaxID=1561998 RepID=A0A1I7TY49_9PELO
MNPMEKHNSLRHEDSEFEMNPMTLWRLIRKLDRIHKHVAIICFIINFFHFLVLTRERLRLDFAYLVLLTISFFNLIMSIGELFPIILESNIIYQIQVDCVGGRPYYHRLAVLCCNVASRISRQSSLFLTAFLALFRILCLFSPMNGWIRVFRKLSFKLIIFICSILLTSLYYPYFSSTQLVRSQGCEYNKQTTYKRFDIEFDKETGKVYTMIDGYSSIGFSILFISEMISLYSKKNHPIMLSKYKKDKSENATLLILFITFSSFISTLIYNLFFFITEHVLEKLFNPEIERYSPDFLEPVTTLQLILSSSLPFICIFVSGKYRNSIRNLIWKDVKPSVYFVRPSTTSSVSNRISRPYKGFY